MNANWTYQYDQFNRLFTAVASNGEGCSFAYDRYGNRWQESPYNGSCNNGSFSFSGGNNRIDTYSYDAAGNLLNDTQHSYTYDAENRIIQVDGGNTATYVYDADGRRVKKTAPGVTEYLYDLSGHVITALDGSGNWARGEVFAEGKHLATYFAGTTYFAHPDWIGTERARSSVSGATQETFTSLPFGDSLSSIGSSPLHFTGKERDSESGNDYFGARFYSSTMGRWLSPDESLDGAIMELPQTWNKYSYEYNRPLYGTDPDGRCPPCIGAIIGGVVEGGFNLGEQLYHNGGNFSKVSWREVGANAAGGAVAGAIAGATGGASLILDAAAGATGNIAGGIVTRAASGDNADQVLSAGAVADDAVSGFIGGGAGHIAGDFVHIPDEPTFHFNGRNGRYYNQAYRAGLRALRGRSTQAFINQGVRAGVASSAASHATDTLWNWAEQWFFNQDPQPAPQPHVTVTIIGCQDMSGRPCQ